MKLFFHSYFFFLSFYPSIHPTCAFSSLSFLPLWSLLSLLPFLLNFLFLSNVLSLPVLIQYFLPFLLPSISVSFFSFPYFQFYFLCTILTSFFHPWILSIMFFLLSCFLSFKYPSHPFLHFFFLSFPFLTIRFFFHSLLPLFLYGIKLFLSWFSPILFLSFIIFASPFFFLVSYNYSLPVILFSSTTFKKFGVGKISLLFLNKYILLIKATFI